MFWVFILLLVYNGYWEGPSRQALRPLLTPSQILSHTQHFILLPLQMSHSAVHLLKEMDASPVTLIEAERESKEVTAVLCYAVLGSDQPDMRGSVLGHGDNFLEW